MTQDRAECGKPVKPSYQFCGYCGWAVIGREEGARPRSSIATSQSHTGRNVAIIIIVVIIIILLLAVIPIPHPFSYGVTDELSVGFGAGLTQMSFPTGSSVSGTFSASLGITAIVIYDGSETPVYNGSGLNGNFNFVASNPPYYVAAGCLCLGSVTVSGMYYSPLLLVDCGAELRKAVKQEKS